MASLDIRKLHGNQAAKMLGHDTRWDGRKDVDYGNKHINKDKSDNNGRLYFRGMPRETAAETLRRLKSRVEALDVDHPPRRRRADRVTMIALEIPAPAGLQPEQEQAFFAIAYQEMAVFCGSVENISPLYVHRDEIHDYVDAATKEIRTSRIHAHAVGIPWTPEHGVNAKNACSRERFREVQQRIDSRCRQELGIEFLTGAGHNRGTVEQAKLASARLAEERERFAMHTLQKTQERLSDCQDALRDARSAQERVQRLQAQIDDLERERANYERTAREAYRRMLDVLQDSEWFAEHEQLTQKLKNDYPEVYENIADSLLGLDVSIAEREATFETPTPEVLDRLGALIERARDAYEIDIADAYPHRNFEYDRYDR